MASGSCQGCEEEDEESLKKLIVRLNNVQEGKQIETLVQILEDMLVFTYADHGNLLSGNCSLPPASPAAAPPLPPAHPAPPPPAFPGLFNKLSPPNFVAAQTCTLEKSKALYFLGQTTADNSKILGRSFSHFFCFLPLLQT